MVLQKLLITATLNSAQPRTGTRLRQLLLNNRFGGVFILVTDLLVELQHPRRDALDGDFGWQIVIHDCLRHCAAFPRPFVRIDRLRLPYRNLRFEFGLQFIRELLGAPAMSPPRVRDLQCVIDRTLSQSVISAPHSVGEVVK